MLNAPAHTLRGRTVSVLTTSLAVAMLLCLAAVATASSDDLASRGPQGLPGPGQSTPPAAQAPDAAIGSSDGGPGAAVIVLITLVGTLALTGVAYSATRFAHRRGVTT
jgi:hypothetical protein